MNRSRLIIEQLADGKWAVKEMSFGPYDMKIFVTLKTFDREEDADKYYEKQN